MKKNRKQIIPQDISSLPWLDRIVDWQNDTADPNDFMEMLRDDLEQDEVFVFTPKGKVMSLPLDATAVDFAYAVHTDVGHRCIGAVGLYQLRQKSKSRRNKIGSLL